MNPAAVAVNDGAAMMLLADDELKQQSRSTLKMPARRRRLNKNDKALLNTCKWSSNSSKADLKLEDKVSVVDSRAVFLQGLVTYVGPVHFAPDIWVGMQLTGPSIGRGHCDGTRKGKKYFADVGKNNGVLAPLSKVNKRVESVTGDPTMDAAQERRKTEKARMADLSLIDALTNERAVAMLKHADDQRRKKQSQRLLISITSRFDKEETHITRLKQRRLEELIRARGDAPLSMKPLVANKPIHKYSTRDSKLHTFDLALAEELEMTQQSFCLSDPTLPDNPVTYASQAFLNMTGYSLNEILGRNCRFLHGADTDQGHVYRIRQSIIEGSDSHVCLLNYRKDGTTFYNRLFTTALRDTRGRIKNYLSVHCEVSEKVARQIHQQETQLSRLTGIAVPPDTTCTAEETSVNSSLGTESVISQSYSSFQGYNHAVVQEKEQSFDFGFFDTSTQHINIPNTNGSTCIPSWTWHSQNAGTNNNNNNNDPARKSSTQDVISEQAQRESAFPKLFESDNIEIFHNEEDLFVGEQLQQKVVDNVASSPSSPTRVNRTSQQQRSPRPRPKNARHMNSSNNRRAQSLRGDRTTTSSNNNYNSPSSPRRRKARRNSTGQQQQPSALASPAPTWAESVNALFVAAPVLSFEDEQEVSSNNFMINPALCVEEKPKQVARRKKNKQPSPRNAARKQQSGGGGNSPRRSPINTNKTRSPIKSNGRVPRRMTAEGVGGGNNPSTGRPVRRASAGEGGQGRGGGVSNSKPQRRMSNDGRPL